MTGPPVVVAFYGGLGEIGANMASVEVDGQIALLDCGLTFPDAEHFGIDLILPDWRALRERAGDVHCVVLTHGHEDHIGALPFFLRDFPGLPVYASRLTLGLVRAKLEEHPGVQVDLRRVEAGEQVRTGPFTFEFVQVSHSIPDGFAVAVHTPHGTILHTGDFKLDQTPIDGRVTDLPHLAQLGDAGVALLLADSTNAVFPGHVPTEQVVGDTLRHVFAASTGRILLTTFASHVHRVQQAIDASVAVGRKVCFVGRSMERNMPIARDLGYLRYADADVVAVADLERLPRDGTVVVCTGSQGEPFAALALVAAGQHKWLHLEADDTVVLASSVIPGNEGAITRCVNGLIRQGVVVVDRTTAAVHVSGHAAAEELAIVHNVVRPAAFVPVHGEQRHLVAHAKIARTTGCPDDQVLVCNDGDTVILEGGRIRRGEPIASGRVYVDGLGVGDVGSAVLRDREKLSSEGVCVAVLLVDQHGALIGEPEIIQRGVIYEAEQAQLLDLAGKHLADQLAATNADPSGLRRAVTTTLGQFWRENVGRRPVILSVVMEV